MSAVSEIADSLRREVAAELKAQRADAFRRITGVRREVNSLRTEHEAYHVETTRGLAAVGDQLAALEKALEPLAAARARREHRRQLARRAVTTAPGLIGVISTLAAAAAAVIALF